MQSLMSRNHDNGTVTVHANKTEAVEGDAIGSANIEPIDY